jgi:hypothetical protein
MRLIVDDSIMLIKGTLFPQIQTVETNTVDVDSVSTPHIEANNTTLTSNKEKDGGLEGHTFSTVPMSEQLNLYDTSMNETETATMPHVSCPEYSHAETAEPAEVATDAAHNTYYTNTSEKHPANTCLSPEIPPSSCVRSDSLTVPNISGVSPTEQEAEENVEEALAVLGTLFEHLQGILVSPPPPPPK